MAVHDLDMTRFLAGDDPIDILSVGSCHIDKSIEVLEGSEAFDTASCIVRYPNGVTAMVDVCRQSSYGYDQRAEVLGNKGMIATDNVYPNTAKIFTNGEFFVCLSTCMYSNLLCFSHEFFKPFFHGESFHCLDFTGNADMPYDFFLSRYNEAYVTETIAFCQSLVNDTPVPCTGEDGLVALIMAIAADKSAAENRWVSFSEVVKSVYCSSPTECDLLSQSDLFPEGFKPATDAAELLVPIEENPSKVSKIKKALKKIIS